MVIYSGYGGYAIPVLYMGYIKIGIVYNQFAVFFGPAYGGTIQDKGLERPALLTIPHAHAVGQAAAVKGQAI
jgi:hypothetical protein